VEQDPEVSVGDIQGVTDFLRLPFLDEPQMEGAPLERREAIDLGADPFVGFLAEQRLLRVVRHFRHDGPSVAVDVDGDGMVEDSVQDPAGVDRQDGES